MLNRLKYAAAAAVLATGLGAAAEAQADVYGYAQSQFSNVTLSYAGGDVVDVSAFNYLSFTDTVGAEVSLSSHPGTVANTVFDDFRYQNGTVQNPLLGTPISTSSCTENGGACSASPQEDFARGESTLDGALVSGVGRPVGVTSTVIGESRVDGDTIGRSTATNTSQGGVEFEMEIGGEGTVDLELSLDYLVDLFVAHEEDGGIQDASAASQFVVTIAPQGGGATGAIISPTPLNISIALSEAFTSDSFFDTGSITEALTLVRGVRYNFSIRHSASVVVNAAPAQVPEPGTVGMLGAGLAFLGIGAVRRRRRDKAA